MRCETVPSILNINFWDRQKKTAFHQTSLFPSQLSGLSSKGQSTKVGFYYWHFVFLQGRKLRREGRDPEGRGGWQSTAHCVCGSQGHHHLMSHPYSISLLHFPGLILSANGNTTHPAAQTLPFPLSSQFCPLSFWNPSNSSPSTAKTLFQATRTFHLVYSAA